MKKVIFMCLCFLPAAWLQAQQRHELTVKEAVDLAFKNVVELKNAEVDYRIQVAQNREITGQALPQLSGNAGMQYYLKLPQILFPNAAEAGIYNVLVKEGLLPPATPIPAPTLQSVSFQQPWNLSVGATLQQLLFQPDVFVGLQARKTALDLSSAVIEQTKEKIKDSAYKRYYAILIAQKQLFYLTENIARLEKLYSDQQALFANGFIERLDIDRVQVQLNNLRTTQSMVGSGVQLSYAALKFALGIPQGDSVVLKEELNADLIKQDVLAEGFRYEDRAEMRTLMLARDLRQMDVKRHGLGWLPTVALGANYSIVGQGQEFFTSSTTSWFRSAYVGLNLSLPLFDGFQRRYRKEQAALQVEKLDNNISLLKQGIDLEQVATRESLRNALYNLDIQERNLELAQKVYNTTKIKYEGGLGSSTEILLADTELQTAQANYFNALYNAVVARVSYQYALGRLQ